MLTSQTRFLLTKSLSRLGISCLMWMVGCATPPSDKNWLRIGVTTKEEVIKHYGEPDLVQTSSEGEIPLYRATTQRNPARAVDIPTIQPGAFGTTVTKSSPIEPGLGARDVSAGTDERPRNEMWIHYDLYGIVREVLE